MRIIQTFFILLFVNHIVNAQIQGISASKLGTYNSETISYKSLEFEPSFFLQVNNSKDFVENKDSISKKSELGFRMTYGLIENIEVGTYIPTSLSNVSVSVKVKIIEYSFLKSSFIGGINFSTNPETNYNIINSLENTDNYGIGVAFSLFENKRINADFNYQIINTFKKTLENNKFNERVGLDISFKIFDRFCIVSSATYYKDNYKNKIFNNHSIILNTGLTYESDNDFIIVLNSPIDFFNNERNINYGLGFAITFIFD